MIRMQIEKENESMKKQLLVSYPHSLASILYKLKIKDYFNYSFFSTDRRNSSIVTHNFE